MAELDSTIIRFWNIGYPSSANEARYQGAITAAMNEAGFICEFEKDVPQSNTKWHLFEDQHHDHAHDDPDCGWCRALTKAVHLMDPMVQGWNGQTQEEG